jgi:selT/selW/selH-like putative selenoprotein
MGNSTEVEEYAGEAHLPHVRAIAREHTLEVEYCAPCNHHNLVMKLADQILGGWAPLFKSFELRPVAWGSFEVTLDGEMIYSKLVRGRHPREGEILKLIEARLGPSFEYADHSPEEIDADGFPLPHKWDSWK